MRSYNIFSKRTNEYVTYNLINNFANILDPELLELINANLSFELGGLRLSTISDKLESIIRILLMERNQADMLIPPNYEITNVLGTNIRLNLRNEMDKKIFWYSSIFQLMSDAVKYKYNLKFIYNDGRKPIDNNIEVSLKMD